MKDGVTIIAFLQNQWFKDVDRVRKILARHADHPERQQAFRQACLWRSHTGRVLQKVFGQDLCRQIQWHNASPELSAMPANRVEPDLDHIAHVLQQTDPDIILAFGRPAKLGVTQAYNERRLHALPLITGPHPAARHPGHRHQLIRMAIVLRKMLSREEAEHAIQRQGSQTAIRRHASPPSRPIPSQQSPPSSQAGRPQVSQEVEINVSPRASPALPEAGRVTPVGIQNGVTIGRRTSCRVTPTAARPDIDAIRNRRPQGPIRPCHPDAPLRRLASCAPVSPTKSLVVCHPDFPWIRYGGTRVIPGGTHPTPSRPVRTDLERRATTGRTPCVTPAIDRSTLAGPKPAIPTTATIRHPNTQPADLAERRPPPSLARLLPRQNFTKVQIPNYDAHGRRESPQLQQRRRLGRFSQLPPIRALGRFP